MGNAVKQEGMSEETPRTVPPGGDSPPQEQAEQEKRLDEAELRPFDLRVPVLRLEEVFVPHPSLEEFLAENLDSDRRVIVIAGDEGSGRFSCAVWLGWKLTKGERVARLPEGTLLRHDLGELARSQRLKARTAYIIEEPFKTGIGRESISDLQLAPLNGQLRLLDSWLILTAADRGDKPSHRRFPWFFVPKASGEFLEKVLSKHLEWARAEGSELPQKVVTAAMAFVRERFSDPKVLLNTAPQIYRFSRALLTADLSADAVKIEEALERLAVDVADETRPRQAWFAALSTNAQFLALLVGAFEGVRRSDLEDIYYHEVLRVRRLEPGLFHDPRQRGFEEVYREIQLDSIDAELKFISESYRREVIRQMGFRHHLLWEVVESVGNWMKALDRPWQWSERAFLGCAVARLGIHRPEKLRTLLLELAAADQATIASLPGYVLRGVCLLDDPQYDFVCELLEEWVSTKKRGRPIQDANDAALLWAAADATQRVYVNLAERSKELEASTGGRAPVSRALRRLEGILGQIAASRGRYVAVRAQKWAQEEFFHALASAVLAMFRSQPEEMVAVLLRWLEMLPTPLETKEATPREHEGQGAEERGKLVGEKPEAPEEGTEKLQEEVKAVATAPTGRRSSDLAAVAGVITRRLFEDHRNATYLSPERRDALLKLVGPVLQSDRAVVDRILEILRDWVRLGVTSSSSAESAADEELAKTGKQWRAAILGALLKACNGMTEGQRRGLRRGLTTLWLASPDKEVRTTAQVVICRARLLEGVPVDLPGASWAGIFVDGSAAGRDNDTSIRLIQELFELLRPQVDLWVGQLGNGEELCRRGEAFNVDELPSRPHTLRVFVPWLQRLGSEETAPAAFHVVVYWDGLIDLKDVAESSGETPLLYFSTEGRQESETGPVASLFRLLDFPSDWISATNEKMFESMLMMVEEGVSPHLSRRLAARDSKHWWKLLKAQSQFAIKAPDSPDRRIAQAETILQGIADSLDRAEDLKQSSGESGRDPLPHDPVRLALGIVQWLAAEDLAATVRLLLKWTKAKPGPRESLARAAAIMLLRIHFERMLHREATPAEPAPAVSSFAKLLAFAPMLARRRSRLGIEVFLKALRHWLTDADWATKLMEDLRLPDAEPYNSESHDSMLLGMTAALPWWMRANVAETLSEWTETPLPGLNEKQVPAAAHALSLRLRYDLALRSRFHHGHRDIYPVPLKELSLVVLSSDITDAAARARVQTLAWDLYSRWERERLPGLEKYVFIEAGRRSPLAVSREGAAEEAFATQCPLVATMAPVLESLEPSAVKVVIVIANRDIADVEELPDWLADNRKLQLFWINSGAHPRPTRPATIAWIELDSVTIEEDGRKIRQQLKPYFEITR